MEVVQIAGPEPENLTWLVFDPPLAEACPEWLRSAAIDADGTAWASAAFVAEHEMLAVLSAGLDHEPVVMCEGHFYLRIPWMRAHCPEYADLLRHFERGLAIAHQQLSAGPVLH
jgi:hypothetical protein